MNTQDFKKGIIGSIVFTIFNIIWIGMLGICAIGLHNHIFHP